MYGRRTYFLTRCGRKNTTGKYSPVVQPEEQSSSKRSMKVRVLPGEQKVMKYSRKDEKFILRDLRKLITEGSPSRRTKLCLWCNGNTGNYELPDPGSSPGRHSQRITVMQRNKMRCIPERKKNEN